MKKIRTIAALSGVLTVLGGVVVASTATACGTRDVDKEDPRILIANPQTINVTKNTAGFYVFIAKDNKGENIVNPNWQITNTDTWMSKFNLDAVTGRLN
jgi:hypothetical protein